MTGFHPLRNVLGLLSFCYVMLFNGNAGRFADSYSLNARTYRGRKGKTVPQSLGNERMYSHILMSTLDGHELENNSDYISSVLCDLRDWRNGAGDTQTPEVLTLISHITHTAMNYTGSFNAREVSRALFGMQGMSVESPGVLELLAVLEPIIVKCDENLNALQIGMSFYGLQGLRRSAEAKILTDYIYDQMAQLVVSTSKLTSLSYDDVKLLGQHFALTILEIREAFNDYYPRWEEINLLICDELAYRKGTENTLDSSSSSGISSGSGPITDDLTTSPELLLVRKNILRHQYISISSTYNLFAAYEIDAPPSPTSS